MSDLITAVRIASLAHKDQLDKNGEPYIGHPIRVTVGVIMSGGSDATTMIVAMLHDVVEDNEISLDHLRTVFGDTVANAIDAVTRREGERYSDFILRARDNPIARKVKLADIADNLMPERSAGLNDSLRKRYESARWVLMQDAPRAETGE